MEQLKGVEDREVGWSEWTRIVGKVGGGGALAAYG